jgi:hypothetical protein
VIESRSDRFAAATRDGAIRVYDDAGNVIETHQHTGDFIEPVNRLFQFLPAAQRIDYRLIDATTF